MAYEAASSRTDRDSADRAPARKGPLGTSICFTSAQFCPRTSATTVARDVQQSESRAFLRDFESMTPLAVWVCGQQLWSARPTIARDRKRTVAGKIVMRVHGLIFLAVATTSLGALAGISPVGVAAQGVVFKGSVEMVPLTVTVTDAGGRYVRGLTDRDFAVFEDGVQQPLSFFAGDQVPLDVVLLVDTSGSMGQNLALIRQAASGLIRQLRPDDRAAVVEVKSSISIRDRKSVV